jgi:hypothetical protein
MKPLDHTLDRLLRAAAAAGRERTVEVPFALEARVLRGRRVAGTAMEPLSLLPVFRRGLAFACLLMLAALILGATRIHDLTNERWTYSNPVASLALTQ